MLKNGRVAARLPAQASNGRARSTPRSSDSSRPKTGRAACATSCANGEFALFESTGSAAGDHTQMGWEVDDIEATVSELRSRGVPGGCQRVRPRLVAPGGGNVDPERPHPEDSGLAIEQAAEWQRARDLMERLLRVASPLGLYAEEFDTDTGRHLGNFPQAFSHLALIEAAARLIVAEAAQEFRLARRGSHFEPGRAISG